MSQKPLIVDWKGLKKLGWPYSRAHTWRMMEAGDFVKAAKLGKHRNSHPVWPVKGVLDYFSSHGLQVAEDFDAP